MYFQLVYFILKGIMIVAAMKRLQDMGASFFILDLRDNRGGLVQVSFWILKIALS